MRARERVRLFDSACRKFKKQEDENGALLLNAPNAFTFELLREENRDGYPAYVLSATPKKRTGPMSRSLKVLSGMHVTLRIEKDTFHVLRGEAEALDSCMLSLRHSGQSLARNPHRHTPGARHRFRLAHQRAFDEFVCFQVIHV